MVYIVNYLPEELQTLFEQPVVVGMAEPELPEVKHILKTNKWQSLINDQTVAEYLTLLLGMKIPVARKNHKVNFKYSDKLIVFLFNEAEEEYEQKKVIVTYYKFVYVHLRPLSEVVI